MPASTPKPAPPDPQSMPTVEDRGDALLQAKMARIEQEYRLKEVAARVQMTQQMEEKLKKEIAEAKMRTRERKELADRQTAIKKVNHETRSWMTEELGERRQAVSEQRRLTKRAIEAKRLALLEQRHADYVLKKQEAAQARITILNAQAAKRQQKQKQMASVREDLGVAKQRTKILEDEKKQSFHNHATIDKMQEEAKVKEALAQIEKLAAEEQRLLNSVLQQHKAHRTEFDSLVQAKPAYQRGLHTNPAPFSLAPPLAPASPMLDRRPKTANDVLTSVNALSGAPATPSLGMSGRGAGVYGSTPPATPRTGRLVPQAPAGTPRGTRPSRPGSAAAINATPIAKGGMCMVSAPQSVAIGASPRAGSPIQMGASSAR